MTDPPYDACYGCPGIPKCEMIEWNEILKDCPCTQCIVKVVCMGDCDDYIYYENRFVIPGVKQYE